MVSAYTVVQRKYFLVMTPDVFFIVACFEKGKHDIRKDYFHIFKWRKEILSEFFFHCFEFLDKTFSIKANGFSVQICAIMPF